jgi:hypothetical protein
MFLVCAGVSKESRQSTRKSVRHALLRYARADAIERVGQAAGDR